MNMSMNMGMDMEQNISIKNMTIDSYFNQKRQRFQDFFKQYHALVESVRSACHTEIDREQQVAKAVIKNSDPSFVETQCAKMAHREPIAICSIIDRIAGQLKQIINRNVSNNLTAKTIQSISLGQKGKRNSLDKFATPIRRSALGTQQREERTVASVQPQVPLALSRNKRNWQNKNNDQNYLSRDQRTRGGADLLRSSCQDNLATCEKLDKQIQQEALLMLQKAKLQRSPSKRKTPYSTHSKSFIQRNDLQMGQPAMTQNLRRRFQ